ncbi:MAG: hypothetical protein JWQ16_88 [Novosphingobium sp.]|nr:hypothetical protein [Novosphingobium sp.]
MTYTDRFTAAFTETVDQFRISRADEVTTAPMPDAELMEHATDLVMTTLFDALRDTRLEALSERLAWGIVHSFHKVADQLDAEADRAAQAVKAQIRDADGSEVGTSELEEAQTICQSLDEASTAVACLRDHAAEIFHAETGRPWSSPRGSLVSSKRTASVIAARDYLYARERRQYEAHAPSGPVVVFSGGQVWEDFAQIWARLDDIRGRIPGMILATTAQSKGCDAIAAAWAARTGTKLVAFTLDRTLGNRAGFIRNEQMIALKPVEAIVCEGSGLQAHLARELRSAGIPAILLPKASQTRAGD